MSNTTITKAQVDALYLASEVTRQVAADTKARAQGLRRAQFQVAMQLWDDSLVVRQAGDDAWHRAYQAHLVYADQRNTALKALTAHYCEQLAL